MYNDAERFISDTTLYSTIQYPLTIAADNVSESGTGALMPPIKARTNA